MLFLAAALARQVEWRNLATSVPQHTSKARINTSCVKCNNNVFKPITLFRRQMYDYRYAPTITLLQQKTPHPQTNKQKRRLFCKNVM